MNKDIKKILINERELDKIVSRVAGEIEKDYAKSGKKLLLLCILKGSVVFTAELMKKINLPVEIDFMKVSSYGGGISSRPRPLPVRNSQTGEAALADRNSPSGSNQRLW